MPPGIRRALQAALVLTAATACQRDAAPRREAEAPVPVTAEAVEIGDIKGVVSATGVVESLSGADFVVIAQEPARILEIPKQSGDHVKSGDVLVRFEFPSLPAEEAARAAALKSADLRLQTAKLVQSRVRGLLERGAASRKEADDADREAAEAEAEAAQAHAAQDSANALGKRTIIRAPFDGLVAERLHDVGDSVGLKVNDAIMRIIDPRQVEIVAAVDPKDISRFAVGATARAVAEGKGAPALLRVAVRPEAVPGSATVPVRLTFDAPTELTSGTQVGVEIDAEQHSNVQLVPSIAVVKDADNTAAVFVLAGSQARKRVVAVGLADAQRVEIRSGLRPGDLVITQGQSNLRDGTAITVSQ